MQLGLIVLLIAAFAGGALSAAGPVGDAAAPGEYLISYAPGTSEAERDALIAAAGGRLLSRIPAITTDLVAFPTAQLAAGSPTEADLMAALAAETGVAAVEPNLIYSVEASYIPNDPLREQQYNWARVDAYDGWGLTRGRASVVIAIIDSGAQLDHPDLQAKLVPGYDFVQKDADPSDGVGHGTHVAGTAGAFTNNSAGVAGACPACGIMPVRVIGSAGTGFTADIAQGIIYAVDKGAKVINLSLGGPASNVVEQAVNYAWSKGAFLTCAAGNGSTSNNSSAYPAAYPACFAVAATTSADTRASYSNYGTWVEVAAPGDAILSTVRGGTYGAMSGTSMAAPHVAGLAGLLASQGYTNSGIRDKICATADAIPGTGTNWTCGRINFERALATGAAAALPVRAYLPSVGR